MKNSYLTLTDQFCGAGGSGQGAQRVSVKMGGGLEIKQALNHWKLATDTYSTNFPGTMVDCTDISACDPRRYHSTDMLITSPECTVHSPAGGNFYKALKKQMELFEKGVIDPSAERSRATMWDVCRFAEYHQYNIIIVENVVEAKTRWPLFDVWLKAMHVLGYNHKCCYINSMHCHPTPQSRDRMYVVFWKKGNKAPNLDFTPSAYCQACDKPVNAYQWWKNPQKKYGKYREQYLYRCPVCTSVVEPYYYAAFNIIDWSIPGKPIIGRKKPLSANTIRRIKYGLEKYGNEYLIIGHRYSEDLRVNVKSLYEDPLPTQTSKNLHGVVTPFIIKGGYDRELKNISQPLPTQTGQNSHGIVVPFMVELNRTGKARSAKEQLSTVLAGGNHHAIVSPFLINADNAHGKDAVSVRSGTGPSRTITTTDGMGVVMPLIIENNGQSKAKRITNPAPCVTTVMKHGIMNPERVHAFLTYYYGKSLSNSGFQAAGTITTNDRIGLVQHKKPTLEECTYRTIRPKEVKAAMAFEEEYVILGNGKQQVRQCGNAVTPPVMEWLVERCVETLM